MKYMIHHRGEQRGPWAFDELVRGLETQAISWTDYVFDADVSDWVMLMEFRPLSENLKLFFQAKEKPEVPSSQTMEALETKDQSTSQFTDTQNVRSLHPKLRVEQEWYVLRGEDKFGPFKYLELVRMLQEKKLFEYEFIWFKGMDGWQKVSDHHDFTPDKIKHLHDSGELEGMDVFFRRKHQRANLGASLIVHDQKKIYKAIAVEISAGGCGVVLNNDAIEIGSTLFLHFKACDEVPPFNAKVEVVSRRKMKGADFKYGFKFLEIAPSVQKAIKEFTKKVA